MIATPFETMALSLSGGGYRATTFHLGAMGYLNHQTFKQKNLLHNVKIISTISGGTITGVMYAYFLSKGGDYQDCFKKLYMLLSKDELVQKAFFKLNNSGEWTNKDKSRDLINAFSEVYNEDFYDHATFANLFDGEKSHLTSAIFGSSEFTYGIQFRLQENDGKAKFGNGYLNLPDEVAKEIRLADATAASSCFPGGFEPMVMPMDFGNGADSKLVKKWNEKSYDDVPYPPTAIMDGGIIDNQGIEGVKLAEERHFKKEGVPLIGTYIVSDVCKDMMAPYKVPVLKQNKFGNLVNLQSVNLLAFALLIALIVGFFFSPPFWGTITSSVILTLIAIYFTVYFLIKGILQRALATYFGSDAVGKMMKDLGVLTKTPIYILVYLVKFRISSVLKMVSELFLRRIRRLQLDSLYNDTNWNYRFKSNYIYSLADEDLGPLLAKTIKMANKMPTTLWFTREEKESQMLDHLIAAGQVSICYNLMTYIIRLREGKYKTKVWGSLGKEDQKAINALEERMKLDWAKFKEDPFWLLNFEKNK